MAKIDIFDLSAFEPGEFISNNLELIFFTCLLLVFFGIVGIALRKQFKDSRALRTLIIGISLLITVLTYYSIYSGSINLNPEGIAIYGAILIFILLFSILFIILQMFTTHKPRAFMLSYVIMYFVAWIASDKFFYLIKESAPLLNGVLALIAAASVIFLLLDVLTNFKHKSSANILGRAVDLAKTKMESKDAPEIQKEIEFEKQERKQIKTRTLKITKNELHDIDMIKKFLEDIIDVLGESNNLTQHQKNHIGQSLLHIANIKHDFVRGLKAIEAHIDKYAAGDEEKVRELKSRYHATDDKDKKQQIQKEYMFERKKIDIFDFWRNHSGKVNNFMLLFDRHLNTSVELMKQNKPTEAVVPIKSSLQYLNTLYDILHKLKAYEKYILRISKKEQKTQEKEKKNNKLI